MTFWRAAVATLALSCAQLSIADAQDWPNKPVRVLIGFGAGGGTDVATRIVADRLSEILGQQFVVENRVGRRAAFPALATAGGMVRLSETGTVCRSQATETGSPAGPKMWHKEH